VVIGQPRLGGSGIRDYGSGRRAHDFEVPRLALWLVDILARNIAESYQMRRECVANAGSRHKWLYREYIL
ncbi:MAG: hypothetical protein WB816_01265, partial [Methylocystis sp.]